VVLIICASYDDVQEDWNEKSEKFAMPQMYLTFVYDYFRDSLIIIGYFRNILLRIFKKIQG